MIQIGTYLKVIDNSGAKKVMCIKIMNSGFKQKYARIGSQILVSVKSIRSSKNSKVKKGEIHKAIIIKTKQITFTKVYNFRKFFENSAVLLNKKNKLIGTRIFGSIPKEFKYSKFLKLITVSSGIIA